MFVSVATLTLITLLQTVCFNNAHTIENNNVRITHINTTGFYYEFYSNLGFVVNTWSFILNVQYSLLLNRVERIKIMSNELRTSLVKKNSLVNCSYNEHNDTVRDVDYILNTKIPNLIDTHNSIEFLLAHKRLTHNKTESRVKRSLFGGAFNFVGRLDKYMFGVMDDRDATILYELANRTNTTDYRIKTLTKETLRLADSLQSVAYNIDTLLHCQQVDRLIVLLKDNLEEIESVYNKIITGIQTVLYSGKLSSLIVAPHLILDEMTTVDSNAWDKETEWVVKPTHEHMHSVMRLIQCSVFINPVNELMFVIQVPRMDKTKFVLYKPVSIPSCKHKMCKFLVPQSRFIGFESHGGDAKHYVRLEDTNTCTRFDNFTLCYDSMTSKKSEYSPNCDVRLFKGLNYNKNCEVHASIFQDEIFYSLNNVNRWLYMVHDKPINAHVSCKSGGFNEKIKLFGTGVITLLNYCKLRTSKTVLMSKHVNNYENEKFTSVQFDFTQFVLPLNYTITNNNIVKSLDYTVLNSVSHNLKKLLTQEESDKAFSALHVNDNYNADWYSNLFGNWWWEIKFVCYAVCIVIIVITIIKIKQICCNGDKQVVPLKMFYPK
ncbi:F-protein [Psilogramma increta granulovirus]|uniref:F-protein n=1 Tax=Psilogramma increta granulovirus TaxID=2953508 RepID=A0A977TNM2_9BBAC|nr:F-protein [Psilogramma increta granulovirus]